MKLLHITVTGDSQLHHGGIKRSNQLAEVFNEFWIETVYIYKSNREVFIQSLKSPLIIFRLVIYAISLLWRGISVKGCIKFVMYGACLKQLIERSNITKVLLETAPGGSILMMHLLKFYDIKYIAFPHNIEFMVPSQKDNCFSNKKSAFEFEVDGYKMAEMVICISKFDKALLQSLDVNAEYLPYYPTSRDAQYCSKINDRRRQTKKGFSFLLGTVTNPPTYRGMKKFLDDLVNNSVHEKLVVGGYGTEEFIVYSSDTIDIKGSLSQEELAELLSMCIAVIVNQPQTTGFLTKLIEMNLSGVPVLCLNDYLQAEGLADYGIFRVAAINDVDLVKMAAFTKFVKPHMESVRRMVYESA
jgi:hypothetical protein